MIAVCIDIAARKRKWRGFIRLSPQDGLNSCATHHFACSDLLGFALLAVARGLAVPQPIRQRHRRALFLSVFLAVFLVVSLASLLYRDSRRRLFGRVSCQAKLLQPRALDRNRGRDGFGFRHDGLADIDARQFAEMSVSTPLYQTVQHNDLLRDDLLRAIGMHVMMTQRALSRSATAIAQACGFHVAAHF